MSPAPRISSLLVQLVALLLATIVLAQAITFLVVSASPALSPRIYTLDEISRALDAGPGGDALRRRRVASLPRAFSTGTKEKAERLIAARLRTPPDQVRFICRPASLLTRLTVGAVAQTPAPRRAPVGQAVQGAFAAAWRRDNDWILVEPKPEMEGVRRISLAFGAALLLVAPVAIWFAIRITRPLRRLAAAAELIGRDPFAPPARAPKGRSEIGAAGEAFTRMQTRIQRYMQDRIGAFAAISHDLRTPLTRIKFKVESAEPKLREGVLADVAQMETMIAAVLSMLREAHVRAPRAPVDIERIVMRAAEGPRLAGRDIEIADAGGRCVIGDPLALERLFANLIENAAKYAAGVRIAFTERDDFTIEVAVADLGPGLPAAELERVFEPFYRAVSGDKGQGAGLGLWIARSIARAHGGDLILRSDPAGLVAVVSLPLAPRSSPSS